MESKNFTSECIYKINLNKREVSEIISVDTMILFDFKRPHPRWNSWH